MAVTVAEDVVQADLRGRSDVADYMVICSGRSSRQVAAIAEKLADVGAVMSGRFDADRAGFSLRSLSGKAVPGSRNLGRLLTG